jgi:Flp pilus assembly protein TadG
MRFGGFQDWRRPIRHTGGAVAVYVALGAAVTFGIVGLAIDATRAMIVQSESQAAADAAALTAASQLDGTSTAITRANNAIANLISNGQRMAATGEGNVTIASTRYLTGLPANDDTPIGAGLVTTDPLQARFVEVTTAPLQHANTFLRAVGVVPTVNIATTAVAGTRDVVCGATPMMICNPNNTVGATFDTASWRGRQVRVNYQANSWTAGNFGFLAPGGNGANALRDALASTAGANACFGPAVTTEPGQNNGARAALNTRFDMYENPGFQNANNNPLFPPDVNVRKGRTYTNTNCNNSSTNANGRLPQDANLIGNTTVRFGNGHWNCLAYWNANFSSSGVARPAACVADTFGFSRYDMYNYEIAHNLVNVQGANNERGTPMCRGNANPAQAGRRVVRIAVVNCNPAFSGRATVPVTAFARVFLTEPVTDTPDVQVVAEIIDVVEPGADDVVLRQIVQLYR